MQDPLEYRGQHAACKVFTHEIEEEAVKQVYGFLNSPAFEGCQIRIMPDVHSGKGAVIGFTSPLTDKVIPNVIGVDIGCGVQAVHLDGVRGIDFDKFDKFLRANVPSGFSKREDAYKGLDVAYRKYVNTRYPWDNFKDGITDLSEKCGDDAGMTWKSCGSLGGGNHFIEVDKDEDTKALWLTVHSGSRHLGLAVATYHQKKAIANMGPRGGLAWLEGDDAKEYLTDMRLAQQFAMLSRTVMLEVLLGFFKLNLRDVEMVTSIHNFIGDDDIIRKGAISAKADESVIIPWNMKDGVVIGKGKGNADWNNSAPHGAGRKMSRGDAKRNLDLEYFQKSMRDAHVWTSCVSKDTLDEAPGAYKSSKKVQGYIGDTVEITAVLKPVYNFKAGGD